MEHLRVCSECSVMVKRASRLSDLLASTVPTESAGAEGVTGTGNRLAAMEPMVLQAATDAVAVSYRHRRTLRIVTAVAVLGIMIGSWYVKSLMHVRHPWGIWAMLVILFAGPIVLAYMTAGLEAGGPSRIYKRILRRQLSGICQGISEAYGIRVWVVRMAFVSLLFLKGIGLALYLLLDIVLPIHPDDRAYLLRFRIIRWWKQRSHSFG
ncbi:MAG: PspC domain-containing protein [Acidobacteriota bacterium]|nr:PspC domain-containing protein [Acidobacteriota bacterium]